MFPQRSLLAVWRKRAVSPEKVSIVGAGAMVPQVSSLSGTALAKESGVTALTPTWFTPSSPSSQGTARARNREPEPRA